MLKQIQMDNQEAPLKFDLELSPKQTLAMDTLNSDSVDELLYGGAKGGGKSVFGCWWVFLWACEFIRKFGIRRTKYPVPIGFMARARAVHFNDTTLETWKRYIPRETYELRVQAKEIVIDGRVKIGFGGFDDRADISKFNSGENAFFFVDQAEEVSQDDIATLRGTQRLKINGQDVRSKALFTANPGLNWLKNEFILNPTSKQRFIQALPSDNIFLHASYIEQLKKAYSHRPELLQAYLYGSWDSMEGGDQVIKDIWIHEALDRRLYSPQEKIYVTCDPARFGDDETVIYQMRNTDIVAETIYGQKDAVYTQNVLHIMATQCGATAVIVDGDGLGGPIADNLRQMSNGAYVVIECSGSKTAGQKERYYNVRAEMWDNASKMLHEGDVDLNHNDQKLRSQLCAPTFTFRNGRLLIEKKDEIKKRIGLSPGRADAYVQALYELPRVPAFGKKDRKRLRRGAPRGYTSERRASAMAS